MTAMTNMAAMMLAACALATCKPQPGGVDGGSTAATTTASAATATTPTLKLPPDAPPPGANKSMRTASELESELLADATYLAIWNDPARSDDVTVLLTGITQGVASLMLDGQSGVDEDLMNSLAKRKFVTSPTEKGGRARGPWMTLSAYMNRTGHFPADFVQRVNTLLANTANDPHKGTWKPPAAGGVPKDYAALALLLHPEDATYLREFIAAKKDGPYKWPSVKDPWRPYLVRERAALERLALITTLTADEQARLAALGSVGSTNSTSKADDDDIAAKCKTFGAWDGVTIISCNPYFDDHRGITVTIANSSWDFLGENGRQKAFTRAVMESYKEHWTTFHRWHGEDPSGHQVQIHAAGLDDKIVATMSATGFYVGP